MLRKIYYISQGNSNAEHLKNIQSALEAGVKLIQLRIKNCPSEELEETAKYSLRLCLLNHAILIINDSPEIAAKINAHGVHLGLNDCSIKEARQLLPGKIIGGTANTIEDVKKRLSEGVDYIGLGPYRFTTTKEKLSPVLGAEGIKKIIAETSPAVPVFAIGGIRAEDLSEISSTGAFGIAVSGLITHATDKKLLIESMNKELEYVENC